MSDPIECLNEQVDRFKVALNIFFDELEGIMNDEGTSDDSNDNGHSKSGKKDKQRTEHKNNL